MLVVIRSARRSVILGHFNSLVIVHAISNIITNSVVCRPVIGEAQKIDRIMEKFAERYCRDNPGAFGSADGAYLLAFALIMLNTDAHNPMADAQLGKPDFVGMCQTQVRDLSTMNVPHPFRFDKGPFY
jgi:hypothetical protein